MYVQNILVQELRCLARTELQLCYPGRPDGNALELPNVNLLVGTNGGGKSTVLKALALAVLAPVIEESGAVPYHLKRRGSRRDAFVRVDVACSTLDLAGLGSKRAVTEDVVVQRLTTRVERSRGVESLHSDPVADEVFEAVGDSKGPSFLLFGYGAARSVPPPDAPLLPPRRKRVHPRYRRVQSLFVEDLVLAPLEAWLPELRRRSAKRAKEVSDLINGLLPVQTRFLGKLKGGEFQFRHEGVTVPMRALSGAQQAYLAWTCDLVYHLATVVPRGRKLTELSGVVLVDEIDRHMHPRWQLRVLATVAGALPSMQLVFTSHSPLIAGSLHQHNLYVMEPDIDAPGVGAMRARRLREDVFGKTADRILTSSYFDLESSRADAFRAGLRKLVDHARAGDADAPLDFLRMLSGKPAKKIRRKPLRKRSKKSGQRKKKR